ncbi:MAG: S1C family serine protease [Spirochaetales bacterium]
MLKQFSEELSSLVAAAAPKLVHIGGEGVSGRTGLIWADGLVVTLAREAQDGETVPVLLAGSPTAATVQAFDARTGLTLLAVPIAKASPWSPAQAPKVGSLAVTVAYASPGGVEARLDVVRFVGGASEWEKGVALEGHFQTDGASYPGFSGAAVVDTEGHLLGMVAENRPGNSGWLVPVADLAKLVATLQSKGTRLRAYLGVNSRPSGTDQGLAITEVEAGSPAETAGLKAGDLLVSLAGHTVTHPMELASVLSKLEAGVGVEAKVLRSGAVHTLTVVPGGR